MKVFIAGITGATGRRLAQQLLLQGHSVVALARSQGTLTKAILDHPALTLKIGNLLELTDNELSVMLEDCDAIGCCLGHNVSFKGIWGQPRTLVLNSVQRLYRIALEQGSVDKPIRLVLMSSNGVLHPDGQDNNKLADRAVLNSLRYLLPPHRDNERAAAFLLQQHNPKVRWCIVRPDGLKDDLEITPFKTFTSALQGPIFSSGFTSRINVAAFMSKLMLDDDTWAQWQGKMPVIYDAAAIQ